jgi:ferredoxin
MQDEPMAKKRGRRVRVWDSCMYKEYTLHASGHNPRPTRVERLKNRIYHKFKFNVDTFGTFGCVGCGRCITLCPVNEDIIENLIAVKGAA